MALSAITTAGMIVTTGVSEAQPAIAETVHSASVAPTTAFLTDNTCQGGLLAVSLANGSHGNVIPTGNPQFCNNSDAVAITPNGGLAFVENPGSTTVTVVNTTTSQSVKSLALTAGVLSDVAVAPDGKTAYAVGYYGKPSPVTPIDVSTLTAKAPIEVPSGAFHIAITPDSTTAYVTSGINGLSGNVTPINLLSGVAGTPIAMPGQPSAVAMAPDGKTAYVYVSDAGLYPLDVATNTVGSPIATGCGVSTQSVIVTPDDKTAYVLCDTSIIPLDVTTGQAEPAIQNVAAAYATYERMAITPDGTTLWVADQAPNSTDSWLNAISTATNQVVRSVPILSGFSSGIALATPPCPTTPGPRLGSAVGIASTSIRGCPGYFVTDSAGQVSAFGSAVSHGDLSADHLNAPIISIAATPDGQGYWLLGADGGVFTFGDAHFHGSTGNLRLNAPVVGMAPTPDNGGYWLVAKDGGIFTFGDAHFYGSTGNLHLWQPVDGIAVAPGGNGYWLVASDGGVFTFTNDGFYGSLGGKELNKPIVGMSGTPDGKGYTLVGSDGGVFNFGDSTFYGSLGANPPASPVVALSPAPGNNGYYLITASGTVYAFGPGATNYGSV